MCAPSAVIGRWIRAQYPLILRGRSAVSLSSGRHDDTVALETSEVFGQSQRHSGAAARIRSVGDHVLLQLGHESDARILDAPDFLRILARIWASRSVRDQSATHRHRLQERAAQRCDKPRRSSTRHSSRVVPSGSKVAPALKTLLMEYGQSLRVRMGLPG